MKPKPSSSIDCAIRSGGSSSSKPSDSSTSAEPACDETERLPCFATPAPAAAATSAAAVEMLNVLPPSPPVPAVSTRSSRFGFTGSTCARIASAQPAISSAVSPFSRNATRKPPICAGVASPDMIVFITSRACVAAEVAAVEQLVERVLDHGVAPEEVLRELAPDRRQHRLGMELHAVDRQLAVAHRHHLAVGCGRRDLEAVGDRRSPRASGSGRRGSPRAGRRRCRGRRERPSSPCRGRARARGRPRRRRPRRSPGGRGRRRASAPGRRTRARPPPTRPRPPGGPGRARSRRATAPSPPPPSTVISSLRRTTTSAPSSPKRCARLYVNES